MPNARRHGLTKRAMSDAGFQQQIMHFAREIAGVNADPAEFAIAARIAAAQIDLHRARHAALALMSDVGIHGLADNLAAVTRLAAIKNYESRFAAHRNKAIRELDAWRLAEIRRYAQDDKTNLTLAGKLAVALAPNEPGSAVISDQRMTERTRPIGAGHTQPPASRIGETNLRASNPACETGGGGEPSSARTGTLMKRTRQCSGSSDKTNPSAEKRAAERAELSSRCNCAEAGMTKRTRAIPASQRKTVRADERSAAARTHSCKTNPSLCARSPSHRGHYICAVAPGIIRGYRNRAPESIASSASFIEEIVPAFLC